MGLAWLGTTCWNNRYAAGISQSNVGTGSSGTSVVTVAHEMGHGFDMDHDGSPNVCTSGTYVMAPYVTQDASIKFSSCSAT